MSNVANAISFRSAPREIVSYLESTNLPIWFRNLVYLIGYTESGWKNKYNYKHKENPKKYTAFGFFQINKSTALPFLKEAGFSHEQFMSNVVLQCYVCIRYLIYLRRTRDFTLAFNSLYYSMGKRDGYLTSILALRYLYGAGSWNAKDNADAKSGLKSTAKLIGSPLTTLLDASQDRFFSELSTLSPKLQDSVKKITKMSDIPWQITSVITDYNGEVRDAEDHKKGRAVDLVVDPRLIGERSLVNLPMISWLQSLCLPIAVVCEIDHLHLDDILSPGLYVYVAPGHPHATTESIPHEGRLLAKITPGNYKSFISKQE